MNDLDAIEKLEELRKKKILTQKEFENEKKKILNKCVSYNNKRNSNIKNILLSLLSLMIVIILVSIVGKSGVFVLGLIIGIILAIISKAMHMEKYDSWFCTKPIWIIITCSLVGLIMVPFFVYTLLQIKDHRLELKKGKHGNRR